MRRNTYLGLICWLILCLTAACTDELNGTSEKALGSSGNLHVLVPTILSAKGNAQMDNSSDNRTYNATVDECQINDLCLFAFPIDDNGNANGAVIKEILPAPLATNMLDEHIATYQLKMEPGKYHIYTVANMNEALESKNFSSEDELKAEVLRYTDGITTSLPVSTNLPMIYEPKDEAGNLLTTNVPVLGKKYTEVAANLKFTCVKVRLNILFDPSYEGSSFAGKSFFIKNILARQLTPRTMLSWDGEFVKPESEVSDEYAQGLEGQLYTMSSDANAKGGYYKEGEWTENPTNATMNDADVITLAEGATPTVNPENAAGKWLFQGTYYLPERYIAKTSQQSSLQIEGSINGNTDNMYHINLGHRLDESSASEVPTFPRGTYYEIIGKPKSYGVMNMETQVSVKDWEPVQINADFNHTTLWVSKTKGSVTSTQNDSISYESNVVLTENDFGCDTRVNNKDVVILTRLDVVNKRIIFSVNKNIKYSEYNGVYTGTAKVWIKAGNIKKYLDVEYNVAPYFDVTPQDVTIYWGSDNNTKVVEFKTNLSGLDFKNTSNAVVSSISSTVGNSTIKATCDNPNTEDGTFKIEATTDPVTTTVHTFYVQPKDNVDNFDKYVRIIRVTVKPAVGNYRINFRAINDRVPFAVAGTDPTKSNATKNYEGTLQEGGNNNWDDGWFETSWSGNHQDPHASNHCIYAYTQIGETVGDKITEKGWIFTDFNKPGSEYDHWPGDNMTPDYTNTGWYYKDFSKDAKSKYTQNGAEGEKTIKPGETLIMFSNNYNTSVGYSLHRCPQHLEPGIPLFDYEDREGWIVYDPTGDPTWHVYDDMPTIENVNFTVYTRERTYGWFKVYGVANENDDKTRNQFSIYDNKDNHKSWTCTYENGWWKTVITLKAIKGDHEKDIHIKFVDNDNADANPHLLFGGNSYEKYHDTGYFENNAWHPGKPSGVN